MGPAGRTFRQGLQNPIQKKDISDPAETRGFFFLEIQIPQTGSGMCINYVAGKCVPHRSRPEYGRHVVNIVTRSGTRLAAFRQAFQGDPRQVLYVDWLREKACTEDGKRGFLDRGNSYFYEFSES